MNFIKKHEALFFYVGTYIFTLILFFIQALVLPDNPFPFFLLAPAIIALIMVAITSSINGFSLFIKELIPNRLNAQWILLSFIVPIALAFMADIIFHLVTKQGINYAISASPITLGIVLIELVGCFGEELGWRGYLLPILSKKHNKTLSSVIVGLLWGLWHSGVYGEGIGFLLFVISTICISIIMTWLYYGGNKGILTVVIFHTMLNLSSIYIGDVPSITYRLITAVVFGVFAIALVFISPVFKRIG